MLTITRHELREPVDVISDATIICGLNGSPSIQDKVNVAMKYLGDKWVLHPSNSPKNKNVATAAAKYFLGV